MPAKAGIQFARHDNMLGAGRTSRLFLDPRLRGDDELKSRFYFLSHALLPAPPHLAGFTLLEVLIALALLGLLLAGLAQGVRFGVRAWELQANVVARCDSLDATDRTLRQLIAAMEPGGSGIQLVAIDGRRDHLSFVSKLPIADAADRRADMTLTMTASDRLVLRWTPHRHDKPFGPAPQATETVLLDGVERLDIAYWRRPSPGIQGGWVDQWTWPGLPNLVRVRLQFRPDLHRQWPDIVIAPAFASRLNQ